MIGPMQELPNQRASLKELQQQYQRVAQEKAFRRTRAV